MPSLVSGPNETRFLFVKQLVYSDRPTIREDVMERIRITFHSVSESILLN